MKKQIIALALTLTSTLIFSQGGSDNWKTDGNTPQPGSFFGTTSNFPLDFRVNSQSKMALDVNGDLKLVNLAGTGSRVLLTDPTGKLISLPAGGPGQFLQSNGTWGSLPGGATAWQVIGNNLVNTNTGFVGIGTTNPTAKLTVIGDVSISNNLLVGGGVITTNTLNSTSKINAGDVDVTADLNVAGSSTLNGNVNFPQLAGGAGIQELFIDGQGNLRTTGIPNQSLITTACTPTNPAWRIGGNFIAGSNMTDFTAGTCDPYDFILKSGNVKEIFLKPTGLVGFGTINPLIDFHFQSGPVGIGQGPFSTPGKSLTVNGDVCIGDNSGTGNAGFDIVGGNRVPTKRGVSIPSNLVGDLYFFVNSSQGGQSGAPGAFRFKNGILNGGQASNGAIAPDVMAINNVGQFSLTAYTPLNSSSRVFGIDNVNIAGNSKDFFNVFGNGYTELKIYNPQSMPNNRVFAIKDVANGKDLFVVKYDGKTYAREVEISLQQSFPDYVFAKEYKLKSINEVESYINENKHLPGFEKGEYYEKNGINVNSLLVKQQEKMEEMMLYIIELEKRLKAIEAK